MPNPEQTDLFAMKNQISGLFEDGLPEQPYCSHGPEYELLVRAKNDAILYPYIQPNRPYTTQTLCILVKSKKPESLWSEKGVPCPNLISVNPINGEAIYVYFLSNKIYVCNHSNVRPANYLAKVERGLIKALGCASSVNSIVAQNIVSARWKNTALHSGTFELKDLRPKLKLGRQKKSDMQGISRTNCLFDDVRWWAYQHVYYAKKRGNYDDWRNEVLARSMALNTFKNPLDEIRVHMVSESVSKWTWNVFKGKKGSKINRRGRDKQIHQQWSGDLFGSEPLTTRDKQSISAQQTNAERVSSTYDHIMIAIGDVLTKQSKVTQRSVQENLKAHGRSRTLKTINDHWETCLKKFRDGYLGEELSLLASTWPERIKRATQGLEKSGRKVTMTNTREWFFDAGIEAPERTIERHWKQAERKQTDSERRKEQVRKLRDEGLSTRAIAEVVGCSQRQIQRLLKVDAT